MKRIIVSILLLAFFYGNARAQYISEVLEYKPGPGQYINTSSWGVPASSETLIGSLSGSLTLGVFGGHVIFKFDSPVENDANNPYGIDFVIYGNPLEDQSGSGNNVNWAEPGIVCVMKDLNGNGEPDDTWYELAGCDYFFSTTIKNYEVTYTNPQENTAADVPWVDNQGNSGFVYANSYHSQPYYPLPENFSNVDSISYTLSGTRVKDFVDRTNSSYITYPGRPWGYVDNNLVNTYDGTPDNPYTDNTEEGSGGDAFDISWAVDSDGKYIDLDEIDFVKVYNGVLADSGWLGEVSTEIRGAFDVAPDASVTGWDSTFMTLNNIPTQVSVGETYDLEAVFSVMGRKKDVDINWSANSSLVSIDENSQLTTKAAGTVTITASCAYNGATYSNSMETTIIAPASIEIDIASSEIRVNEKSLVQATVYSQNDDEISDLEITWEASNNNVEFKEDGDSVFVAGVTTGTSTVYAYLKDYPDIKDSVDLTILDAADSLEVYLTIKTEDGTYLPKEKINVSNYNLNPFVKNGNHSYDISDISNITLAHAVASVFDNVSFESDLRFKDTEDDGLYIYKLPVQSGSSVSYYYGYGNTGTSDSQKKCWIAKIGDNTYYNNFDDVTIYENDDIVIYHIEDVSSTWALYTLTASELSVNVNTPVSLKLTCDSMYFYSESVIMTKNSSAVANESVSVDDEIYSQTDDNGEVELIFSESGVYSVVAADEELNITVTPITGINDQELAGFVVYPNPANQTITIQPSAILNNAQLQVCSMSGTVVYADDLNNSDSYYFIDVSTWNNGVYLVRIVTAEGIINKKIVVKH